MWKRWIGVGVGLAYAICYGFWTMMLTGGGHGNFLWFMLFLLAEVLGIFFPVLGFVVVDLRPIWAKITLGLLLALSLGTTAYLVAGGLGQDGMDDILKSWNQTPFLFIFATTIHFAPFVVSITLLLKSIFVDVLETPDSCR